VKVSRTVLKTSGAGDSLAEFNIRNRGICLISTVGQTGIESACAASLLGTEATESRQVAKSRILRNQET
jgi:putative transposase